MGGESVEQVLDRLGSRAPQVMGGPIPGFDVEVPPHVIFTRVHGRWEEFIHLGEPVVIDGGTVDPSWTDADLFARGYMGIKVRDVAVVETPAAVTEPAPPAPMTESEALTLAILALNTVIHPEGTDEAGVRLLDQEADQAAAVLARLRDGDREPRR